MMVASKQSVHFAAVTLFFILVYSLVGPFPIWVDITMLIVSLVITGIPHGAIDHVIYLTKTAEAKKTPSLLKDFFAPYLFLIGLTFLLWILVPEFMFWFFLLVAAYHFGQSQLFYLPENIKPFSKFLIYIVWGIMLLATLWHLHWGSQVGNIASIFSWDLSEKGNLYHIVKYAGSGALIFILLCFVYLWLTKKINMQTAIIELSVAGILILMIKTLPLYIAFAIYFGLWHSTRVIITEFHFLQKASVHKITIPAFVKSFIPFSILSFAGLIFLIGISYLLEAKITPFMLFLIFISALTMPHAFFMEKMYSWLSFRRAKSPLITS
jgi:beta-carotene 15,15'-dioxygenase